MQSAPDDAQGPHDGSAPSHRTFLVRQTLQARAARLPLPSSGIAQLLRPLDCGGGHNGGKLIMPHWVSGLSEIAVDLLLPDKTDNVGYGVTLKTKKGRVN